MPETIETLAQRSDAESFEPGEPIYREREPGSVAFLLVEGEVVVESEGHADEIVSSGQLFGEAALFGERQRHDSARAVTAARVVPIGPALYESLAASDSSFAWTVRTARSRRLKRIAALAFAGALLGAALLSAQIWDRGNQLLIPDGDAAQYMSFGGTLATGDFKGDGIADLAIGSQGYEHDGLDFAGRVDVHLGTPSGLAATASFRRFGPQAVQFLGCALAAGDFNGDGRDDLAIGAWGSDLDNGAIVNAGTVEIWRMNAQGSWGFAGVYHQDSAGMPGVAEGGDQFGSALAVGDFDGDGYDDLAVGAPGEAVGDVDYAGAVNTLYGSATGLTTAGSQIFYRNGGGLVGDVGVHQTLGATLAAGDFDADGCDELAIGIPDDYLASAMVFDGSVLVLDAEPGTGLVTAGQMSIDREQLGVVVDSEAGFGSALAAGDLDRTSACAAAGHCADDLAIGAPGARVDGQTGGLVHVLFGNWSEGGLSLVPNVAISQSVFDFALGGTAPESEDNFGNAVAVGSLGNTLRADLAVGTSQEGLQGSAGTGCAHVARKIEPGFDPTANPDAQFFFAQPGLGAAPAVADEYFGAAVAIGDFNGDGWGDLAVGVAGFDQEALSTGAVQILYGALFADGFESAGTGHWSD